MGGPRPAAVAAALGALTAGVAAVLGTRAAAATAPALALSAGTWFVGALAGAAVVIVILLIVGRMLDRGVRSLGLRSESERLESEVALARAEARFRTVFEGAPLVRNCRK